jgi:hypothetical protein
MTPFYLNSSIASHGLLAKTKDLKMEKALSYLAPACFSKLFFTLSASTTVVFFKIL